MINQRVINKSCLAPRADRFATEQIKNLILNTPVTILVNNYKSSLFEINLLRTLVRQHDGFAYQPNKNVKTRAFKDLGTVLSSDLLNGLVVFTFFTELPKALKFLEILKSKNFYFLSYFALLLNGHLANLPKVDYRLESFNNYIYANSSVFRLNIFLVKITNDHFIQSFKKIHLILNAYVKSVSKGAKSK